MPKRTRLPKSGSRRKTSRMNVIKSSPISLSGKYYSFEKDNGKYKVSLGNFSDAGWYWSGDKSDLGDFIVRLANSKTTQKFIGDAKSSGLKFSDIKADVISAIKNNDSGMYAISGDNVQWHFGQDLIDIENEIDEFVKSSGKSREAVENVAYDIDINNYDKFVKSPQFQSLKSDFLEKVQSANDFPTLMNNISGDFERDSIESVMEFQSNEFYAGMERGL